MQTASVQQILDICGVKVDSFGLSGFIVWQLWDEESGQIKDCGVHHNLITRVGDQYYGERATGISSPPGQVTGMKLGTGTTTPAKTGAGAAMVTYTSGSHVAISGGYPTSSLNGSSRQIQWQAVWSAGTATANSLAEVIITNQSPLADDAGDSTNTIARALLSPTVNKGASDSLSVTWNHLLLGA